MSCVSDTAEVEQFSEQQKKDWQQVVGHVSAKPNGIGALDFSDDHQFNYVVDRFGGSTHLSAYFPQFYKALKTTRSAHEAGNVPQGSTLLEMDVVDPSKWHPYVTVSYLDLAPDNETVVAQGIITLPNDATSVAVTLVLYDEISEKTIAEETLPAQYNTLTQQIEATGKIADARNMRVVATLTATYQPAGSPNVIPITKVSTLDGASVINSVTVINPNHDKNPHRDYTKVCLGRNNIDTEDCDYLYNFGRDNGKFIVGLSVEGYAQLDTGFVFADPADISGSCILRRRSAVGDGASIAFPPEKIPELCTATGTVISWNIGPDWFQGVPWDQNQTIDLEFVLNFQVQNLGMRHLSVTSVPPVVGFIGPSNIAPIDPMKFVWGCVAAGTPVEMADGSVLTADQVRRGASVASPDGPMTVVNVWHGVEEKPMARLVTSDGHAALVTDEHPILTPEGLRLPKQMQVGQKLLCKDGETTLVTIEWAQYDGEIVNFDLAPSGEDFESLSDDLVTAFYADGLAVGDNRIQGLCADAEKVRAIVQIADLPEEYRLDVTNSRRAAQGLALVKSIS